MILYRCVLFLFRESQIFLLTASDERKDINEYQLQLVSSEGVISSLWARANHIERSVLFLFLKNALKLRLSTDDFRYR